MEIDSIFIDSDVILDVILDRDPHYVNSIQPFSLLDVGVLRGCVSSLAFSNIYYLLRKVSSHYAVVKGFTQLRNMVDVLSVDQEVIDKALASGFRDFEDALQHYSALKANVDVIITRNKKDYKKSELPVMTPEEFRVAFLAGA